MSFSFKTADGVTQLVRVVEEPYLIAREDWKTMRLADSPGRRLLYEADGGMSCGIEQDILPAQAARALGLPRCQWRDWRFALDDLFVADAHKRKRCLRIVPSHEEYRAMPLKQACGDCPACRMKHVTFLQTVSQPLVDAISPQLP